MRIQNFPLAGETPARLQLHWDGGTVDVVLDGERLATLPGAVALLKGWSTVLEDGSVLEIRGIRRVLFPELAVLRNGRHVESSPSHPLRMLRSSANTMLVVSAFLIVAGALGIWGRNWISLVFGCFYLAGALLLRGRRRLGAAVISIPLFLDCDYLLLVAFFGGMDGWWWTSFALNLLFGTFVIRAYQAANDSRQLDAPVVPRAGLEPARPFPDSGF